MLGGASEQAVLLLIESCANSIKDPDSQRSFQAKREKASFIHRKFEIFQSRVDNLKASLPSPLKDHLDSLLRGIFDLIRSSRNGAGHPAITRSPDRDAVYSHLRLFIPYCQAGHGTYHVVFRLIQPLGPPS